MLLLEISCSDCTRGLVSLPKIEVLISKISMLHIVIDTSHKESSYGNNQ